MTESDAPAPRKGRSSRGRWTVIAMFVLGGVVLAGLFLAPRPKSTPAPANVPVGVPAQPLKFVVYDLAAGGQTLEPDVIAREIVSAVQAPDYVILLNAPLEDAAAIAAQFGMQGSFDPRLGQRLRPAEGGDQWIAACLLSRYPLYDAQALTASSAKAPYGIRAWSEVGGQKFLVACIWATPGGAKAFADSWKAIGAPPAVVGIVVDAKPGMTPAGMTPAELTGAGFDKGWGLPEGPSSTVPGRWRPRLVFAGPWQAGAGASWDTNNTRVGVWSSLAGRPVASQPTTEPESHPAAPGL